MNIGKYVDLYFKELLLKNYSKNTIENYCGQVKYFLSYFNDKATKPSEISEANIKDWLLQFKTRNAMCHAISAVKLFYIKVVNQPLKFKHIQYPRSEKRLPLIIDKTYLLNCIDKIRNKKHKAIISLAYSTGMRVSEVCNLKISDIDSRRMIITIKQSKGKKDRIVKLSDKMLEILRAYFKEYRPSEYLFNGQFDIQYTTTSCNQIVKKYIGNQYHFHLLRHANACSLLEAGTDLRVIQSHLGHASSKTTEIYTKVSTHLLQSMPLPI